MSVAKKPKTVASDSTVTDPDQESEVLKYLLSHDKVQVALQQARRGDLNSSRNILMETFSDMVAQIYKSKSKAPAEPSISTFEQLLEYYMSIQSRVGRKGALKEFNSRLSNFEVLPTPSVATRHIINQGLNSPEAVRPCAELLADLISVGHIATRILTDLMPPLVASLDDISAHNPSAPDIFVIAVSEIALHAPADRVSNENLISLIASLGSLGAMRYSKVATGRGRQLLVQHLSKVRGATVEEVERQLGSSPH